MESATILPNARREPIVREADVPFDVIEKPAHYNFTKDPAYEVVKVIEAWDLGYHLGNAVKYIARGGKKVIGPNNTVLKAMIEDLKKARWYLNRKIETLEAILAEQETKS